MFNQILVKSIQIGDRIFHVLCDVNIIADDFEKLGVEIIKIANDIKNAAKQPDPEVKEETSPEPIQGE
jgi:hypothetical protein